MASKFANKRNKHQREHTRMLIAQSYLRGLTQAEIAGKVGLSQQQISADLKLLHRRWVEASGALIDEQKAKELAKIDALEREYWQAWERSLQPRETTSSEQVTAGEKGGRTKAQLKREETVGNPAFLEGVRWCVDRRIRLFGFDAPAKVDFGERTFIAIALQAVAEGRV